MLHFEITEGGWLDGLPLSQRNSINRMLDSGKTEEEVAILWLSKPGPGTNFGFGGSRDSGGNVLFYNIKIEFIKFVCGSDKYNKEREKSSQIWNKAGKPGVVTFIAATISPHTGYAVVAIVPIVALLFSITAKVSVGAFCTTYGDNPTA